jgi:hypothetical protein
MLCAVLVGALALAAYGNHLHRLRRQEAAFKRITAKGGTVFYSPERTCVDFSLRSKPTGMGVYCSNERVLCPDYQRAVTFSDADLTDFKDVVFLWHVDFTGSKVSKAAAFRYFDAHSHSGIGYASTYYSRASN